MYDLTEWLLVTKLCGRDYQTPWIRFALQKKAKILNLDFMACVSPTWNGSDYCYVFPSDVLQCSHLVELHLDNCRFQGIGIHLVSLSKLSLIGRVRRPKGVARPWKHYPSRSLLWKIWTYFSGALNHHE